MLESRLDSWDKTYLLKVDGSYIARLNLLPFYLWVLHLCNCDGATFLCMLSLFSFGRLGLVASVENDSKFYLP